MLKKRLSILVLSCFGVLCVGDPAWAIGIRAAERDVALGQPLDVSMGLTLAPGDVVDPDCVRAQVTIGDVVQPREAVGAQILDLDGRGPVVRVRTLGPVNEPVVSVNVSVGCSSSVSRTFVMFADPPGLVNVATISRAPEVLPEVPAAAEARTARAPASRPSSAANPDPGRTLAAAAALSPQTAPRPPPKRRATPRTNARREAAARSAAKAKEAREAPADTRQVATTSRLRLDAAPLTPESAGPSITDDALAAVRDANAVVLSAIAAASSAQGRMALLESTVERLRVEAQEQAAVTAQLRERAALAERRTAWVMPLLGAIVLVAGLAVWLWLRLRALDLTRQADWRQVAAQQGDRHAVAPAPPGSVPMLVERSIRSGRSAAAQGGLAPAAVISPSELFDEPVEPHYDSQLEEVMRTRPLPVSSRVEPMQPKGVSAEELIDLEQQAEFFIVLGQEDSAIELLVRHLRETGGTSPLPYLKLLDIYRDMGDQAAYDRTRERFNQRFNALAPEWGDASASGRALSDYPAVLESLQAAWSRPLDAMADLESLLFRRDGGELFDLPAYRDLLFLYSLARDLTLLNEGRSAAGPVDVLLPLHDTPAAPVSSWAGIGKQDPVDAATAPVDLDLTEPTESGFSRLG